MYGVCLPFRFTLWLMWSEEAVISSSIPEVLRDAKIDEPTRADGRVLSFSFTRGQCYTRDLTDSRKTSASPLGHGFAFSVCLLPFARSVEWSVFRFVFACVGAVIE